MAKKKQKETVEETNVNIPVESIENVKPLSETGVQALSEGMQKLANILKEINEADIQEMTTKIPYIVSEQDANMNMHTKVPYIVGEEERELFQTIELEIKKETETEIKIKEYLNWYLKDWENNKGLSQQSFKPKSLSNTKFNQEFRKFFTSVTGLTVSGCNCGATYIKLLDKLRNYL